MFTGVKHVGYEVDSSASSSAEVKLCGVVLYAFMVWKTDTVLFLPLKCIALIGIQAFTAKIYMYITTSSTGLHIVETKTQLSMKIYYLLRRKLFSFDE